jgi:hypothetical protein
LGTSRVEHHCQSREVFAIERITFAGNLFLDCKCLSVTCSDVCESMATCTWGSRTQGGSQTTRALYDGITVNVWKNVPNMEHICRASIFFLAYFGRLTCSDVCGPIVKNVPNMEHICRASIFFLAYFGRLSCSDVCGSIVGFELSQRVPKQSAHHVLDITVSVWKNVANR